MSRFRVYINPRDELGNFTGFREVTSDVNESSFSSINEQIDNDEFNVGVFEFNSFTIRLRNDQGLYSDIDKPESIFRSRRGGCPVKITWQQDTRGPICGLAIAGKAILGVEKNLYVGLLNDEDTNIEADSQEISFRIVSKASVFSEVETPFSSISPGDNYSDTIKLVLNQSSITDVLTFNAANISVGLDLTMDVVSEFENTTVKEALDSLLFQSNSVLFIENDTIFVKNRDGGASSVRTFYGYGGSGVENVVDISNLSNGKKKLFNFWTWEDTNLVAKSTTSINNNGIRKKQVSFDEITNNSKRQQILDAQRDEFSALKQSFDLTTFLDYENLDIGLLDKVNVDVPAIYFTTEVGGLLPLYGSAIYGEAVYPESVVPVEIDALTDFKIMGRKIDLKKQLITFRLEEI